MDYTRVHTPWFLPITDAKFKGNNQFFFKSGDQNARFYIHEQYIYILVILAL